MVWGFNNKAVLHKFSGAWGDGTLQMELTMPSILDIRLTVFYRRHATGTSEIYMHLNSM